MGTVPLDHSVARKRVLDPQAAENDGAMVHILRPKSFTVGVQRCGHTWKIPDFSVSREVSGHSIVAENRLFPCFTCPFFSPLQQDPLRSGPRLSSVPQSLSRHVPAGSVKFTRFRGSPFQVRLELDRPHGSNSEFRPFRSEISPPSSSTRFFK